MIPEAQRIAIAEACGWRCEKRVPFDLRPNAILCWIRPGGEEWQAQELPDYLNSLDCMHEAEKVLKIGEWQKYHLALSNVCGCKNENAVEFNFHSILTSNASQRAEAFLKTLSLWK